MAQQTPSPVKKLEEHTFYSNRFLGLSLILTQILIIVAYGLLGNFYIQTSGEAEILETLSFMIMMGLFTLVGFGLLLASYRNATWIGMLTTLLTVALGIQANPLMQKLWFGAFFTGFTNSPTVAEVPTAIQQFWSRHIDEKVSLNFVGFQTALLSCVGILVVQTAVIGRASLSQCLRLVSIYQIMWNLNYFLNIYINYKVAPEPTLVFDAYGASFLYLFSAAFGLAYTFFLPQKISSDHPRVEMNRVSLIFGMIGTGFIVCTFAFATAHYLSYSDKGLNIGGLNIYFALSASIIGTFIGSALFGRGRVGYKEVLVGSVSGAVMISSIAPIFDNIGIIIMLGLLAGLISGIYMQTLHKAINKTYIYDSLGLFGPFLINSFIGSMVVAPSVLDRLVLNPAKTNFNIDSVNNTPTVDTVGFQLVYVGVSLGIGLFSGLFAGLFSMCEEDKYGLFANSRFFRRDYSLYRYVESDTRTQSANNLKPTDT